MNDTISRQAAIDAIHCDITVTGRQNAELVAATIGAFVDRIKALPSAEPEIIYCKDCVKHNKGHGYYLDGTIIGIKDCCPLIEIRGMAQGHEFDYQYCAYAERRTDE